MNDPKVCGTIIYYEKVRTWFPEFSFYEFDINTFSGLSHVHRHFGDSSRVRPYFVTLAQKNFPTFINFRSNSTFKPDFALHSVIAVCMWNWMNCQKRCERNGMCDVFTWVALYYGSWNDSITDKTENVISFSEFCFT